MHNLVTKKLSERSGSGEIFSEEEASFHTSEINAKRIIERIFNEDEEGFVTCAHHVFRVLHSLFPIEEIILPDNLKDSFAKMSENYVH